MTNLYNANIDHEYYARKGRQMQAQEAWTIFGSLKSQIKNTFSGKNRTGSKTNVAAR